MTHLGQKKIKMLVDKEEEKQLFLGKDKILQQVTANCDICAQVNAGHNRVPRGARARGNRLGTQWEIDFTEVKPGLYRYRYLLVFVDTFSGWVEAYPTKHETARVVAKKLLEEVIPHYGIPHILGSDNGPAFISQVSQSVAKALGINWKLHCAYNPRSSGQVERVNRTIKETLTKLTLAPGTRDWVTLLPLALYRARNTPGPHGLTPFEILYGAPPPAASLLNPYLPSLADSLPFPDHLQVLQIVQKEIWQFLAGAYQEQADQLTIPHRFQVGDSVWVRRHQLKNLEPRWKGPFVVLLTTPTALKVDSIAHWIHAAHVKLATSVPESNQATRWKAHRTPNPLKIRLSRS